MRDRAEDALVRALERGAALAPTEELPDPGQEASKGRADVRDPSGSRAQMCARLPAKGGHGVPTLRATLPANLPGASDPEANVPQGAARLEASGTFAGSFAAGSHRPREALEPAGPHLAPSEPPRASEGQLGASARAPRGSGIYANARGAALSARKSISQSGSRNVHIPGAAPTPVPDTRAPAARHLRDPRATGAS